MVKITRMAADNNPMTSRLAAARTIYQPDHIRNVKAEGVRNGAEPTVTAQKAKGASRKMAATAVEQHKPPRDGEGGNPQQLLRL